MGFSYSSFDFASIFRQQQKDLAAAAAAAAKAAADAAAAKAAEEKRLYDAEQARLKAIRDEAARIEAEKQAIRDAEVARLESERQALIAEYNRKQAEATAATQAAQQAQRILEEQAVKASSPQVPVAVVEQTKTIEKVLTKVIDRSKFANPMLKFFPRKKKVVAAPVAQTQNQILTDVIITPKPQEKILKIGEMYNGKVITGYGSPKIGSNEVVYITEMPGKGVPISSGFFQSISDNNLTRTYIDPVTGLKQTAY